MSINSHSNQDISERKLTHNRVGSKLKSWQIIILFVIACFFPFSEDKTYDYDSEITELQKEVISLRAELDSTKESLALLEAKESERILNKVAIINAYSKSFVYATTDLGTLLFSVDNVEQYGSGYKIDLKIGNTTSATFRNAKLNFSYGEGDIKQKKEESLMTPIYSARWNSFEIILPSASKEDLNSIAVVPELNIVSFR